MGISAIPVNFHFLTLYGPPCPPKIWVHVVVCWWAIGFRAFVIVVCTVLGVMSGHSGCGLIHLHMTVLFLVLLCSGYRAFCVAGISQCPLPALPAFVL